MDKDSCKAAFTARVHRYLYSKDSNDESEKIYESEVNSDAVREIAGIDTATSFDPRDKLLERHEKFIRSQLAIIKRIQLKGILSVSSKQSVEEPVTTSEPVGFVDECSVEKDDKVPQTRKNRKRKLKKKRRKEQQLIAKKLKEETASDLGGDIVDNTPGPSNILCSTPGDIVDNATSDTNDSTLSGTDDSIGVILPGDGIGIPGCTPGDTDDNIHSNIPGDLTDNTPSDIPT